MYYNAFMLEKLLAVPAEILELHAKLKDAGYGAYLVGGCVRDLLLGITPKDWDITTNARPEQIQSLFAETFYENEYGTVGVVTKSEDPKLKVVEITPYRIEGTYSDARRPDEVRFSDKLEDDLKRRDFTINAIAYDPDSGELVDPHNGRDDIRRRSVAAVGEPKERFAEDALRILRAVRISAELDFTIEAKTMAGIAGNAAQLEKISRERVRDELIRIIMSPRPMQAFYIAQKLDILKYVLPELEEGIGVRQNQAHSFDVFEHNVRSLQHAADQNWPLPVRLAAILHDIGKPRSRRWSDEKKDWTFYGHDVIGARMAKQILGSLRVPTETSEKVVLLVRWHMFFSDPDKITLSAVRRVIRNVGTENIWDLLNLRVCDRIGTGRPKAHPFRLRKYMSMVDESLHDPVSVAMLNVNGEKIIELGQRPGPRIGWILHALLEEVLDEPKKNSAEYLEERARQLIELPDTDLKRLGEQGKERKLEDEAAIIEELRKKHHVS